MPKARRSYVAVQVTLTSADTNYEILALVNAILGTVAEAPGGARDFVIQAHPGIDGAGTNTSDVLIGDGELSATRFGTVLIPGASETFVSTLENVQVGGVYARSAGAGQKLNIKIIA